MKIKQILVERNKNLTKTGNGNSFYLKSMCNYNYHH